VAKKQPTGTTGVAAMLRDDLCQPELQLANIVPVPGVWEVLPDSVLQAISGNPLVAGVLVACRFSSGSHYRQGQVRSC